MIKGLTTSQAEELLKYYGLNEIKEQKRTPLWRKFLEQFNNFLTVLLIIAAFISFLLGEVIDSGLIVAIVILNALFGLYQESKAEESIAALKKMTITKVRVIRDGKETQIDSRYLVPGDLVFIEEGTKIPADGELIEAINLEVNESALTGESLPVGKKVGGKKGNKEAISQVYAGTIVSRGRGLMKVLLTGNKTKFGQIATKLSSIDEEQTPLQKKLKDLTRVIGIIGIVFSFIVFFLSLIDGSGYFPAFLLAVSLAVAIVPEGLPAVMTIILTMGVKSMAEKKSIVRKLSAIEALGSVTLIATDKTGTLTENKMKVKEIFVDGQSQLVDKVKQVNQLNSNSQSVDQDFRDSKSVKQLTKFNRLIGSPINFSHSTNLLLLNGILCSTASLVYVRDHGRVDVLGDPTEGALLYLAKDFGLDWEIVRSQWRIMAEEPFSSVSKMMKTVVENRQTNEVFLFSKGAPESILPLCSKILIGKKEKKLDDFAKTKIEKQVEKWASKGLRVLAFSYKANPKSQIPNSKRQTESKQFGNWNLEIGNSQVFLGLVAIHDAPRPEVVEAVAKAKKAGIKVVMITGDNEKTAEAVGVLTKIISEGDEILNGEKLEKYTDEELLRILPKVKIFARTNPFQKHRIVKLYQQLGEIVVVTGDGVNDAIALKQADVGVAMGLVGTDVARETADMVITDDNFASIVVAVEEGRNIIKNLKNAIKYLLSANMSEVLSLIITLIIGASSVFYPIQFLYINLITDGIPALSLAFSPKDESIMKKPPAKRLILLNKKEFFYIFLVGIGGGLIVFFTYLLFKQSPFTKTATFSVLTLIQSFIYVDLWFSHQSVRSHWFYLLSPLFLSVFLFNFFVQFIIVSNSNFSALFKVPPVILPVFIKFVFLSSSIFFWIKIVKRILRI